jgi:hypothetical protein
MKIAIMQPYFLPYIGYFQLMNTVDRFVIYDNIKYTKKGWINRNRILVNGKVGYISLSLKNASDYLNVNKRELSVSFDDDKNKILRVVEQAYQKAPYFEDTYSLFSGIMNDSSRNLFDFLYGSLKLIHAYLGMNTELMISSSIPADHDLKSQERVISICKALHATEYINPPGGVDLYAENAFSANNIKLRFLQTGGIEYQQFNNVFVSNLSILDVMMFNSRDKIQEYLAKA